MLCEDGNTRATESAGSRRLTLQYSRGPGPVDSLRPAAGGTRADDERHTPDRACKPPLIGVTKCQQCVLAQSILCSTVPAFWSGEELQVRHVGVGGLGSTLPLN